MKKYIVLAAAWLLAACTEKPEVKDVFLNVEPAMVTFAALDAEPQTVSVSASGIDGWGVDVTAGAKEWLSAEQIDGNTVRISVSDNLKKEERTGAVIITVPEGFKVKNKEITVVQKVSEEVFDFTLSTTKLEFAGEGAASQTVTVEVPREDLAWSATVDHAGTGWITIDENDAGFTVSVTDNPSTKERVGVITVSEINGFVVAQDVIVAQKGIVLPPSVSILDDVTELTFDYLGNTRDNNLLMVLTVNTDWDTLCVDENGNEVDWITAEKVESDDKCCLIGMKPNPDKEERIGYVKFFATEDVTVEVAVKLIQAGAQDHLSELTDDVDLTPVMRNSYAYSFVSREEDPSTTIFGEVRFWSDGVEHDTMNNTYSGTGEYVVLPVWFERIEFSEDNLYYIPETEYMVTEYGDDVFEYEPNTIHAGDVASWNVDYKMYSWYYKIENGEKVQAAPIKSGSMSVSRSDNNTYRIICDFADDMGFKLSGEYNGEFEFVVMN